LLGYFPGFNGVYWSDSTAYERDRPLFKQYMPLIRKIVAAGWKPIPYATPSDPAIYVERFDNQTSNTFYLTAQNSSTTTTKTFQMTVDGASLQIGSGAITVNELVGNSALSATRSGSNILFSDTLAAGETAVYQITETGGSPPPQNGSFETGLTSPTGWTLGTSVSSGSWAWDSTTAASGTRSVKLTVSGTANQYSPILESSSFPLGGTQAHTLSAWVKSSGVGGTYPPEVYVVELDGTGSVLKNSTGAVLQHAISAARGTAGWTQKSVVFTTDPRCVKAYVYANIYKGYGTVWVDAVQIN